MKNKEIVKAFYEIVVFRHRLERLPDFVGEAVLLIDREIPTPLAWKECGRT
jgi:hypothetical protein